MDKKFFTAGRAVFTIETPDRGHFTYKITKNKPKQDKSVVYFVALLTGPDNTQDYTYLGIMTEDGAVRLTAKSKYSEDTYAVRLLRRTLNVVFADQIHLMTEKGFNLHHEGKCGRCGRALTVPESILSGIGPECRKHI